jgi:hypothetical protein
MRGAILQHVNRYLSLGTTLSELVAWAQDTLVGGGLSPEDEAFLQDLLARAGEPGGEGFGLTMEDCAALLEQLGQELRVSTGPLVRKR